MPTGLFPYAGRFFLRFFVLIVVAMELTDYFKSISLIKQSWAKTGGPGKKTPDLPYVDSGFLTCGDQGSKDLLFLNH